MRALLTGLVIVVAGIGQQTARPPGPPPPIVNPPIVAPPILTPPPAAPMSPTDVLALAVKAEDARIDALERRVAALETARRGGK